MAEKNLKNKTMNIVNEETGADFYSTSSNDESFSYEIQMEKEYIKRLKQQREKIEALYSKYDVLLGQMKKKDQTLRQKDEAINKLSTQLRTIQLSCQEISLVRQQNRELMQENMGLKNKLLSIQNQNMQLVEQIKLKKCLISDQKQELEELNDQLQDKIKILNNKLLTSEEQLRNVTLNVKKGLQQDKQNHLQQVGYFEGQISRLREQLIKKQDMIHMLKINHEFLEEKLSDQEENYSIYLRDLEAKIEAAQKDKKRQIRSLKQVIQEKDSQIIALESKITSLQQFATSKDTEVSELKNLLTEQKRLYNQDMFVVKQQANNEKNYLKQQFLYCQNHINRLEGKLKQGLRREKYLQEKVRKLECNDRVKKDLREIQKQQMEKINRILSMQ